MQQAAEQVGNTPLADFSIGLCLFLAAFVIVLFFKDEPKRRGSGTNPPPKTPPPETGMRQ
jgi:hypothetical protein